MILAQHYVDGLTRDIAYAARRLRHSMLMTSVAVLTLAAGIGVTTAVFTAVNGALLRLHVTTSERVVKISLAERGRAHGDWLMNGTQAEAVLQEPFTFVSQLASVRQFRAAVTVSGVSRIVNGEAISGNYLALRGVQPLLGRLLGDMDARPSTGPVVVISERLWNQHFNSSPDAIGQLLTLAGSWHTIVGVLPASTRGLVLGNLLPYDVWVPREQLSPGVLPDDGVAYLLGELRPDASFAQADAEIRAFGSHLESDRRDRGLALQRLSDAIYAGPPVLFVAGGALLVVAVAVFAIAGLNITNLLLTSMAEREREVAIRLMLGAKRGHLLRLVSVETALVVSLGLIVGLGLSRLVIYTVTAAMARHAGSVPAVNAPVDWRVLAFAFGTAAFLCFAISTALAARASAVRALTVMSAGAGGAGCTTLSKRRMRLVAVQISAAVAILLCAGLTIRATAALTAVNSGFSATGVVVGQIDFAIQGQANTADITQKVLGALREEPSMASAAVASGLPGSRTNPRALVSPSRSAAGTAAQLVLASPSFLRTVGLQLVEGRELLQSDSKHPNTAAVISRGLSQRFWPSESPLGQRLTVTAPGKTPTTVQVVGVSSDTSAAPIAGDEAQFIVMPLPSAPPARLIVVARSDTHKEGLAKTMRDAVSRIAPDVVLQQVQTLEAAAGGDVFGLTLLSTALSCLGLVGGGIALVGVYTVTSSVTYHRKAEVAIRMAVGARPQHLYRALLSEALPTVAGGVLAGIVLGIPTCLVIRSVVLTPVRIEVGTIVLVSLGSLCVGILAAVLPLAAMVRNNLYEALRS